MTNKNPGWKEAGQMTMKQISATQIILIILISTIFISSVSAEVLTGSVTILAAPTNTFTSSGSSSSGGSGSGGTGVVTSECFSNVQEKETRENDLRAGQYVTYSFTSDIPVYEIQVKGLKNDYDVAVRLEQLFNLSCKLVEKPRADIYRYVNIFSGVQQDGVIIKFKISNNWLSGGIVYLDRWDNGSWTDLPTIIAGRDKQYTYYESHSQGFSSFAIIERLTSIPAPTPVTTVTAGQVQPTDQPPAQVPTERQEMRLIGFIIIALSLILILAAGTIYIIRKKCKE